MIFKRRLLLSLLIIHTSDESFVCNAFKDLLNSFDCMKMIFSRLVVPFLTAGCLSYAVTANRNVRSDDHDDTIRKLLDKVDKLQERITNLEAGGNSGSTVHYRSTSAGMRYNKKRYARGLSTIDNEDQPIRRLKSEKSNKSQKDAHHICYGQSGLVGAFHLDESGEDGDLYFERTKIDLGLISVGKDEGLMLDITASSLIINAVGGFDCEGDFCTGGRRLDGQTDFYIVGSGLIMYPRIYVCHAEDLKDCQSASYEDPSDEDDCVRAACLDEGDSVQAEPNFALPLSIAVRGAADILESAEGGHVDYEIDGTLDIETHNVRFFASTADVADADVYVELAIVAGSGGIHIDDQVPSNATWTLGGAVLGPHLIEVSTMKSLDGECEVAPSED